MIKREGGEWFRQAEGDARARINYGITLHSLLARIHHTGQRDAAFQTWCAEQATTDIERETVSAALQRIFSHPVASTWYDPQWQVRTEAPVLLPGGQTRRMDRVMLSGQKAVVVDYKTGDPRPDDQQQVASYTQTLRDMGYTDVEGFLLYLDKMNIVKVGDRKSKPSSQLPLFG